MRRHESDAQVRREGLGKAADVNHAPPVIETGEPHGMPALQIAVNVVFEDHEIMAGGELEHSRGNGRAHARARGVVCDRIEDEQLGPFARQQAFERDDIRPVSAARYPDDARTEGCDARKHDEPGGIFDEHEVARREKSPRHQVDGLGCAGTGDDLLGRDLDACLREPRAQCLAQR